MRNERTQEVKKKEEVNTTIVGTPQVPSLTYARAAQASSAQPTLAKHEERRELEMPMNVIDQLHNDDSKNMDTFDNAIPYGSGSLAELATATAELPQNNDKHIFGHSRGIIDEKRVPMSALASAIHPPIHPPILTSEQHNAVGIIGEEALSGGQQGTLGMLEASLHFLPDGADSDRPKQYNPRNPYPTPACYPTAPLLLFDSPPIFEKFDTDTLFFIFYYQQGSYQQYLAARELKKQIWRFHKKYLTWFQRHEEPKEINAEYEQGTYVYFDYETGWCQRKKAEFTFEYRYLETTPS